MKKRKSFNKNSKIATVLLTLVLSGLLSCNHEKIDFNAQVRPILNKNCISCHGGVKQSGGFGLVFRENALKETKSGKFGIVPGSPEASEMMRRINHKDPEMRMPLEKEPLSENEVAILTKWIEQGAEWEEHWSYLKPADPEVPNTGSEWPVNEIDHFVEQKLKEHKLAPSPIADKFDLARRVALDLTGLPLAQDRLQQFVGDNSGNAYEDLVDDLLNDPGFGEHWASMWLDLARYADSQGYVPDNYRSVWKYRDWVIRAFNQDMPFDQFTIEQLAGDLLPDPSIDQLIATAFHRNTMSTNEGGTNNEEYRISAVMDRVNTTWEVWQGTTMSCVQCHSHPYDPIRHHEFYTSFAFFNNTTDWDGPVEYPLLKELYGEDSSKVEEIVQWITAQSNPTEANKWKKFMLLNEPSLRAEDFSDMKKVENYNRSTQDFLRVFDGSSFALPNIQTKEIDRVYLHYKLRGKAKGRVILSLDSMQQDIIGQANLLPTNGFQVLPIPVNVDHEANQIWFAVQSSNEHFRCDIESISIGEKLPAPPDEEYQQVYASIDQVLNAPGKNATPVMVEKNEAHSRETHVFVRGNWMVHGEQVAPAIPGLFDPDQEMDFDNRLDMARWLVSQRNPLTARVIVNRFWAKIFGKGLVVTVEDFGTLGDLPTHPQLLDWLAIRFSTDWQWSVKKLLKTIVMSATYCQSSVVNEENKQLDPYNQWLSRSPRIRLSAEQIRDQALAVSGLLSRKMYGRSVMPYQPDGVWNLEYSVDSWKTSPGEDAFRRGVYTYFRRSSPYPSFITFDASERDACLSRRIKTNTPLQALVTLNDPVYMQAARHLAGEVLHAADDDQSKVTWAYQKVMGKQPDAEKVKILLNMLDRARKHYVEYTEEAYHLAKTENMDLAVFTVMANALMNMDEFLVKN